MCWVPLPINILKANFDAASWENGCSSAACVVRDHTEALLLAAGFLCYSNLIEEAKMRVVWETIRLLYAYYPDRQVWVEGDAQSVIQGLRVSETPQDCSLILKELRVYQISQMKATNVPTGSQSG